LIRRSLRTRRIAGRLCPNPLLDDGRRLDDELGPGFGLLTTEALTAVQQTVVADRGARAIHAAPDSELARWLESRRMSAAVVRPDRTVMAAGRDITALCRTLPSFPAHAGCTPEVGR
jgi:3-(3-hydroxy-phenyl)propionate hydroxylase